MFVVAWLVFSQPFSRLLFSELLVLGGMFWGVNSWYWWCQRVSWASCVSAFRGLLHIEMVCRRISFILLADLGRCCEFTRGAAV